MLAYLVHESDLLPKCHMHSAVPLEGTPKMSLTGSRNQNSPKNLLSFFLPSTIKGPPPPTTFLHQNFNSAMKAQSCKGLRINSNTNFGCLKEIKNIKKLKTFVRCAFIQTLVFKPTCVTCMVGSYASLNASVRLSIRLRQKFGLEFNSYLEKYYSEQFETWSQYTRLLAE